MTLPVSLPGRTRERRPWRRRPAALPVLIALLFFGSTQTPTSKSLEDTRVNKTLRICRYDKQGKAAAALYFDDTIVDLSQLHRQYAQSHPETLKDSIDWGNSLPFLARGAHSRLGRQLNEYYLNLPESKRKSLSRPLESVVLLPPVPYPPKFLLLAGNYAEHIEEGGGKAEERADTIPYFFWKPPTTTWKGSGVEVPIPLVSPNFIDWEIELGVVIATECKGAGVDTALASVAGYTIINDLSDRRFFPNPDRKKRDNDEFFDWLHGKWFDGFAPIGPCVISADDVTDPQNLPLQLKVNGTIHQNSNTRGMIFGVADLIAFISTVVTLEPGDVISTGTPSGVGSAREIYLRPGDRIEAEIGGIGVLKTDIASPGRR